MLCSTLLCFCTVARAVGTVILWGRIVTLSCPLLFPASTRLTALTPCFPVSPRSINCIKKKVISYSFCFKKVVWKSALQYLHSQFKAILRCDDFASHCVKISSLKKRKKCNLYDNICIKGQKCEIHRQTPQKLIMKEFFPPVYVSRKPDRSI